MKTHILTPELLHRTDAYWRAANYLSVGQIAGVASIEVKTSEDIKLVIETFLAS